VGDEDHRLRCLEPHPLDLFVQSFAGLCVERRERLVHQQCARLRNQRPGERASLAHASRECVDARVGETEQVDEAERLLDSFVDLVGVNAGQLQRKRHVFAQREPRKKRGVLKHHGAVWARADDLLAACDDLSAGQSIQAGDEVQQGGLAAAGRPEQADEFACADLEIHVVNARTAARDGAAGSGRARLVACGENLFDAAERDGRALRGGRARGAEGGRCGGPGGWRQRAHVANAFEAKRRSSSLDATRPVVPGSAGK
jgi:hypothetical protein